MFVNNHAKYFVTLVLIRIYFNKNLSGSYFDCKKINDVIYLLAIYLTGSEECVRWKQAIQVCIVEGQQNIRCWIQENGGKGVRFVGSRR